MGAGKTTLGKALSKEVGMQFIDLDWHLEERFHKTIQELFKIHGEPGFRQLEKRMLHEIGEFENVVISTGGGTPCFFDNIQYMNRQGTTVWLDARPEVLLSRLCMAKTQRPLLSNKPDEEIMGIILETLQKRRKYYAQAKYVFNADELEDYMQIKNAVQRLRNALNI